MPEEWGLKSPLSNRVARHGESYTYIQVILLINNWLSKNYFAWLRDERSRYDESVTESQSTNDKRMNSKLWKIKNSSDSKIIKVIF